MKQIPLTRGLFAVVDDDDYEKVASVKWQASKDKRAERTVYYPVHGYRENGKTRILPLTHFILSPPKGMQVDHINGDTLDNRRENLRIVTPRENCQNLHIKKSSDYAGVHWSKSHHKWQTQIRVNNRSTHLGFYQTEEAAHDAYVNACISMT